MYKGQLTREQAIAAVGAETVARLDTVDCDYTGRLMPPGWEDVVEFSAAIPCKDADGLDCRLIAHYYQDASSSAEAEDLGDLEWEIHGYEIV